MELKRNGVTLSFDYEGAGEFSYFAMLDRFVSTYTAVGLKLGFGPARKLPRIADRKSPHINNMGRLTIGDPRGFGAVQIPSFKPTAVYSTLKKKNSDSVNMVD